MNRLTDKQKRFADLVLQGLNPPEAARQAGYLTVNAYNCKQMLKQAAIAAYMEQQQALAAKRFGANKENVIAELAKIAFSNLHNYYQPDGSPKALNQLSPDELAAIEVYEPYDVANGGGTIKPKAARNVGIRLYNKLNALDKLARHFGINRPTPEVEEPFDYSKYLTDDD